MTRKTLVALAAMLVLLGGSLLSAAPAKPKSVIHVVTVKWKSTASEADIKKAIAAVETMAYPGLKNVWTRPIKMQMEDQGYKNIIVMEFESEAALKNYTGSEAQKKWYEVYMPVREESRTHDITN